MAPTHRSKQSFEGLGVHVLDGLQEVLSQTLGLPV